MLVVVLNLIVNGVVLLWQLFSWHKSHDNTVLIATGFSVASLILATLSYAGIVPFFLSLLTTLVLFFLIWWRDWKLYRNKKYLVLVTAMFVAVTVGYYSYIEQINLSIPLNQWPLSYYIVVSVLVSIFVLVAAL